ncbi:MAG: hypothetical protein AAGG75_28250 [Bacteroidota bacterium]
MNEDTKRTLKRISLIGIVLLIAAMLISAVEKKRSIKAKEVLINIQLLPDSTSLIKAEDILLTIERSFGHRLVGVPLGAINIERVERVLEADPFVLTANAYVDAQQKVHISLEQRIPILRIIDRNGTSYYLDTYGERMPPSKHFTARVLVATGNIPPYDEEYLTKRKHVLKDLYELTKTVLSNEVLQSLCEQIYVDKKREYVLIPKVGRQKILLGKYHNIEDKLFRLFTFYNEGIPYTGWNKYSTINLKYKGQVVCKKR